MNVFHVQAMRNKTQKNSCHIKIGEKEKADQENAKEKTGKEKENENRKTRT